MYAMAFAMPIRLGFFVVLVPNCASLAKTNAEIVRASLLMMHALLSAVSAAVKGMSESAPVEGAASAGLGPASACLSASFEVVWLMDTSPFDIRLREVRKVR